MLSYEISMLICDILMLIVFLMLIFVVVIFVGLIIASYDTNCFFKKNAPEKVL